MSLRFVSDFMLHLARQLTERVIKLSSRNLFTILAPLAMSLIAASSAPIGPASLPIVQPNDNRTPAGP